MSEPVPSSPPPPPEGAVSHSGRGETANVQALYERAERIMARHEEVLRKLENPPSKDWWARTPVVVAVVGLLFTSLYQVNEHFDRKAEQRRVQATQRLELMSKFFPHLISDDPTAQRGAVLALDLLADSALAAAAVLVAPSPAAAGALQEVRINPVSLDDAEYVSSVTKRLPRMLPITRMPPDSIALQERSPDSAAVP